jgi:DNA-binding XRE family transcriptional regulator
MIIALYILPRGFMEEVQIKKLVGKKIKNYRKSLKLTQEALGELIDINQRQIALIEAGKSFPSLSTLNKMASVFNCKFQDFFENGYLKSETELKEELKIIIDKLNYKATQTIYLVAKNL